MTDLNDLQTICTNEFLNGLTNFEFDGIDMSDYPDFADATILSADDADGNELSDEMLDYIRDYHSDFIYEKVMAHLF